MPRGDREKWKADLEDGGTMIANLLLEAMPLARLSGPEYEIILFVWRRTWGWMKDESTKEKHTVTALSLTDIVSACSQIGDKSYASRVLAGLVKKNILVIVTPGGGRGKPTEVSFNTQIDTWIIDEKVVPPYNVSSKEGVEKKVVPQYNVLEEKVVPENNVWLERLYHSTTLRLYHRTTFKAPKHLQYQGSTDPLNKYINKYYSTSTKEEREGMVVNLNSKEWFRTLSELLPLQVTPAVVDIFESYEEQGMEDALLATAIRITKERNKRHPNYIKGILHNWLVDDIKTMDSYKALCEQIEASRQIAAAKLTTRVAPDPVAKSKEGKYGQLFKRDV